MVVGKIWVVIASARLLRMTKDRCPMLDRSCGVVAVPGTRALDSLIRPPRDRPQAPVSLSKASAAFRQLVSWLLTIINVSRGTRIGRKTYPPIEARQLRGRCEAVCTGSTTIRRAVCPGPPGPGAGRSFDPPFRKRNRSVSVSLPRSARRMARVASRVTPL